MTEPRLATGPARLKDIEELEREIGAGLTTQRTAQGVEKLDAAEVPGGPVFGYDEIMRDAHIKARHMVVDMDHPVIGPMKTLGMPIKSTGELTAIRKPAPWLGQHSAEVLRSLGCDSADIDALFESGVVYDKFRANTTGAA